MRMIDGDLLLKDYTAIFVEEFGNKGGEMLQGVISQSPTVDAQPVIHAKWEIYDKNFYRCSSCMADSGYIVPQKIHERYCPWCGAKMEQTGENIDG